MKICPVCNDSFADQLNFCDIDGARLTREGSAQERNKWWSLLGAGLLVAALVISAASIFFLPKARVSAPIVTSEPQSNPAPPKSASESAANVAATAPVSAEPESVPTEAIVPEVKKKDKALVEVNVHGATPDPKAAALAAEDADKKSAPIDGRDAATPASKKLEASPSTGSDGETRSVDTSAKPQPPPDLNKDTKTPSATAKSSDKDSNDKKKNDDKDKKKGGFLRVFKKIFGKD
jgi:hypothetical protein